MSIGQSTVRNAANDEDVDRDMIKPNDHQNSLSIGHLPVSLRPDLETVAIRRGLQTAYTVKDPVNLKYYEFDEHEMALLQQLNGKKRWDELREWFNRRFPPLRLSHLALHAMVWRLHQQGLLTTSTVGQGRRVTERVSQLQRQDWIQRLSTPWAIRLPGINPGPWLGLLNSLFGWVFSQVFVVAACIGMTLLLAFAFAQHDTIIRMKSGTVEFFSRENVVLFALVVVVTKILHELGHAISAYRQRCECHEIGILLLAGLPSLYCDVSDAWMLPTRWQRIGVSLAGIWIEALVAALAYVVWSTSVPGLIHAISLNLMIVCSVGTLLFNANPLVRYDGYYVLMDLSGISNLGQRSNDAVERLLLRWVLGSMELRSLDSPEIPGWCLIYGFASSIYRVLLTWAILWGLYMALKPYSLGFLIWLIAFIGLMFWGNRMFKTGAHQVRRTLATGTPIWRCYAGVTLVISAMVASTMIPIPWYVFGEAVLEPADRQTLVTAVPGRLAERKDSGSKIEAGELIARIENQDIQQEIQQMEAEFRIQDQRLKALVARRNQDLRAGEQIPGAQAALDGIEHRLAYLLDEQRRLEFRASEKSVIYPAPIRLENQSEGELANWNGSLLDPINRDAWVSIGDNFCQFGSIDRLEAIAILAQDDLEEVMVGQRADLYLKSSGKTIRGEIVRISNLELDAKDESPLGLVLPRAINARGHKELHRKWYQVQIHCLAAVPEGTLVRSRSKVRIHAGWRTVGEWVRLQFFKTFRWHA